MFWHIICCRMAKSGKLDNIVSQRILCENTLNLSSFLEYDTLLLTTASVLYNRSVYVSGKPDILILWPILSSPSLGPLPAHFLHLWVHLSKSFHVCGIVCLSFEKISLVVFFSFFKKWLLMPFWGAKISIKSWGHQLGKLHSQHQSLDLSVCHTSGLNHCISHQMSKNEFEENQFTQSSVGKDKSTSF